MRKRIACIVIVVCLLIAFGATVTVDWLYETFEHLSMDEIIFHLKVPMQGTNTDIIATFMKQCLWKVILPSAIIALALIYPMVKDIKIIHEIHTSERRKTILVSITISILILIISIDKILKTTDIKEYIKNQTHDSNFIAKEYIRPEKTKIEFQEEKRNLIYIFLESMETTYYSVQDGGLSQYDLMPEISKLAKENINFSDTNKLGGAYTLYGTTWTVGAMAAQTAGVPLKLSIEDNAMEEYSTFLGGAYSIGQVLQKNGYHNFLLLGSDATFGGRRNLFEQHGNYEIWDFESAKSENKATEQIWWGFTDDQLFEYAKEKILYLSEQEQPFNFTMLTADTHFPDGYKCKDCPDKWDEQYITMQSNFFELEEGQEYQKKVVNLIINPAVEPESNNREYSTMDLYPTTLAALGANIDGNKLGLGTNLFSNEETLIEKYGLKYVNDELMKISRYYNKNILVK